MANVNTKPEIARYVCIDGTIYAVKPYIKFVVQCKRGFLHGKDRKPELVVYGKNTEWTPKKEILQAPHDKFKAVWPLRLDAEGRPDWKSRVFETTDKIPNVNLPFVDCTK